MAGLRIDDATSDTIVEGNEFLPASDGQQPRKISTAQIADYVLGLLKASGAENFSTSGTVSWKNEDGALKFASGTQFARAIIAWAFAQAAVTNVEGMPSLAATDTFIVKQGDEEHVMSFAQLTTYLSNQITATIELYGMASADALSGANLFLVAQGTDGAQTNKKVSLSTVRSFILNGIGAYLKDNSTLVDASEGAELDPEQDPEFVFSYKGTTLRKWRLSSMIALAGDVHGPSTTTLGKVPQWSSTQKALTDGLAVSIEIGANSTNAQLPTAAAAKTYADNAVAARFPNASTAGNVPTYTGTDGKLGAGKAVVTAVGNTSVASDGNIPTEKAVRDAIQTERTYVDDNVKINVGTHSQGDLAKFATDGRSIQGGPTVTTEVSSTAVAASDSKLPTEKAVRTAIANAMGQGIAGKEAATTVRSSNYADDNHVPTEHAVAAALDTVVKTGLHADGEIPRFDGAGAQLKGGTALVTEVRAASNASNAAIATEKAVRTAVNVVQTALDDKKLDDLAAPDEGTKLDASSSRHGLMSAADKAKLDGLVDHNGASEINAALTDNDTFLVSDVSVQAVKKSKISRIWDYILNLLHETPLTALKVGADVTTSNATTEAPGLLPKLDGDSSKYLKGDGTWGTPAGSQVFTPDTGAGGTTGLVPAPEAGDATKVLFGNGLWGAPPIQTGSEHVSIVDQTALESVADAGLLLAYQSGAFYKVTMAQLAAYAQGFIHYDVLWVPAGAITPNVTNGAVAEVLSRGASNLMASDTIRFASDRDSFADFDVVFPDDWNGGSIKLKFYWTPYQSTATAGQVVRFGVKGRFFTDEGPITDDALTYNYVQDAMHGYNEEHVSPALAITIEGTYLAGKRVHFWLKRDATSSSDTLNTDASLLGVAVQFARTGNTEAW